MTGEDQPMGARACVACGEPMPAHASVCPTCGTLQPPARAPGAPPPARPRTIGARPVDPAEPDQPAGGIDPAAATGPAAADRGSETPRRRRWPLVLAVAVVLAVAAGGAVLVLRDDDADPAAVATETTRPSDDERVNAVRRFCSDPKPLTGPGEVAEYVPGAGAVSYVEVPAPTSTTAADDTITIQVAPAVGTDPLELETAVGYVSLVTCASPAGTRSTDTRCAYELTNKSELGERRTTPLVQTSYRLRVYEVRTAEVVATGTLRTPDDTCPEQAYVGDDGVSAPLARDQVLAWLGEQLATG